MAPLVKSYTAEELIKRGPPKMFTTSAKEWKDIFIDWWENHPDGPKRKLYPAQVERLLIDMLSYGFSLLGKEAQTTSEQRWLLFAKKHNLDVAAGNNSTFRLKSSPATCEVEFYLSNIQPHDLIIDKGTELTSGGLSFLTDSDCVIRAGSQSVTVGATATKEGEIGNGFLPGQLSAFGGVSSGLSARNITETVGGADEESDQALTYRAANAHDRISKAGGRESYRQQIRAFSPAIIFCNVERPEPGHINIYTLLNDGLPDGDFRGRLFDWMDPESKRPQGDELHFPPTEVITCSALVRARAKENLTRVASHVEQRVHDASSIWSQELGLYLAKAPLTCAAKSVDGLLDVDIDLTGLDHRQLLPSQCAVLTDVQVQMETA